MTDEERATTRPEDDDGTAGMTPARRGWVKPELVVLSMKEAMAGAVFTNNKDGALNYS